MGNRIKQLRKRIDIFCDEMLQALDLQTENVEATISLLTRRRTELRRKRSEESEKLEKTVANNDPGQAEKRYKQLLGELDDVDETIISPISPPIKQNFSVRTSKISPVPKQVDRRFPDFPKVNGEIFAAYRLTSTKGDEFETIDRHNEYFTRSLAPNGSILHAEPAIYLLELENFLQLFFDEIRHIESCLKYREANWKKFQAQKAMERSYEILVKLIEEVLESYDPKIQVSPVTTGMKSPSCVRVRLNSNGTIKIVAIDQLRVRDGEVFMTTAKVSLYGYLQEDLKITFPLPTIDVMNAHLMKIMRQELKQYKHEESFKLWRSCKLRIQELGNDYYSGVAEQLNSWLA